LNKALVILIVLVIAVASVIGALFVLNNNGDNEGQNNPTRAELKFLSLSLDKHHQFTGNEINVSVEVQNIGKLPGNLPVNFTINGENYSFADNNYLGPGEKKIITKPIIMLEENFYSLCAGNYSEVCNFWEKYKVGMYFKYHYWTTDSDQYFGGSLNEGDYTVTIIEMSNTTLTLRWSSTSSDVTLIDTVEKGSYLFLFKDLTYQIPPIYSGLVNASYMSEQLICDRFVMDNQYWWGEIWARQEFVVKFSFHMGTDVSLSEQLIKTNAEYLTINELFLN